MLYLVKCSGRKRRSPPLSPWRKSGRIAVRLLGRSCPKRAPTATREGEVLADPGRNYGHLEKASFGEFCKNCFDNFSLEIVNVIFGNINA
jgi:hypothetical protein